MIVNHRNKQLDLKYIDPKTIPCSMDEETDSDRQNSKNLAVVFCNYKVKLKICLRGCYEFWQH